MRRRLLLLVLALAPAASASAWPAEAYKNMVYDAVRLLPPSLGRVLWVRDEHLIEGVATLEGETASRIARAGLEGRVSPELVADVESRVDRIVGMVDGHQPFQDVAVELGRLLRIAADLSDPTVVGAGRPELRRVAPEYLRFVDLNLGKIPLVHDKSLPSPVDGAPVSRLLSRLAASTSDSVAPLASAFWREGRVVPAARFDFRSVPYAECSLSYSRGVTAASYLWLSAWSKANGDFTGYRFSSKKP